MLSLAIPAIIGCVSTAEERNLGLHEWHLTLPVPASRQWLIKVLVALGVNGLLGILLPLALMHGTLALSPEANRLQQPEKDIIAVLAANLVLLCAGLYASTASSNSLRAVVGMVCAFTAPVAAFFTVNDYVSYNSWALRPLGEAISKALWQLPRPDHVDAVFWRIFWTLVALLAVWLYYLGLANYRRSLDSLWSYVRKLVVFCLVGELAFLCMAILNGVMSELVDKGWAW